LYAPIKMSPPREPVSRRWRSRDRGAHVSGHHHAPLAVFPADLVGPGRHLEPDDLHAASRVQSDRAKKLGALL